MVFPITCNAVGDVIAVAQLVYQIVKALSDSRGASQQYQQLLQELRLLQETLGHASTVLTSVGRKNDTLDQILEQVAQCSTELTTLHRKIEGYRKKLAKDSWRAIGWALFKQDEMKILKDRFSQYRTYIVLWLTIGNSASASILVHFVDEARRDLMSVKIKLNEVLTSLRRLPRALGYSLDNGVRFIDALGKDVILPMTLCSTWDKFDAIVKAHFKQRVGQIYVERGQYDIACDNCGVVMDPKTWSRRIKCGLVLEMSIVLSEVGSAQRKCPRCRDHRSIILVTGGWAECLACDAKFRSDDVGSDTSALDARTAEPDGSGNSAVGMTRPVTVQESHAKARPSTADLREELDLEDPRFFKSFHVFYLPRLTSDPVNPVTNEPPEWLAQALREMREQHPDDRLETVPKATSHTDPQRRVICQDCPGRLYSVGPGETLKNFELHLKNRQHRQRVADRVANAQTAGH